MTATPTYDMALRTGNWGTLGYMLSFHAAVSVQLAPEDEDGVLVRLVKGLPRVPRDLREPEVTAGQRPRRRRYGAAHRAPRRRPGGAARRPAAGGRLGAAHRGGRPAADPLVRPAGHRLPLRGVPRGTGPSRLVARVLDTPPSSSGPSCRCRAQGCAGGRRLGLLLRSHGESSRAAFAEPTTAQVGAWEAITAGRHALVVAPTGSGKTLSAFLWSLDRLLTTPPPEDRARRTRVPLHLPAQGPRGRCGAQPAGPAHRHPAHRGPARRPAARGHGRAARRHLRGRRRRLVTRPPDILITTPESLFLMLTSQARETLRSVETVIVDEVHALAGTKRGAHLAVTLERLDALLSHPAQRIGLSATVRPPRGGRPLPGGHGIGPDRVAAVGEALGPARRRTRRGHDRPGTRPPTSPTAGRRSGRTSRSTSPT